MSQRKTSRSTAGKKPDRFGFPSDFVSATSRSEMTVTSEESSRLSNLPSIPTTQLSTSRRSVTSRFSSSSQASSIRKINKKLREDIAALEDDQAEQERALLLLETPLDEVKSEIARMWKQLEATTDEDERKVINAALLTADGERKKLQLEYDTKRINFSVNKKIIERKISRLQQDANDEREEIEEAELDDSQEISDYEMDIDQSEGAVNRTVQFVESTGKSAKGPKLDEDIIQLEEGLHKIVDAQLKKLEMLQQQRKNKDEVDDLTKELCQIPTMSAKDKELQERFKRLKDDMEKSNTNSNADWTNPQQKEPTLHANQPLSSDLSQLVNVMAQAFSQAQGNSNNNSSTDKFLARQVHGKDLPFFSGRPEEWITFSSSFYNTTSTCKFEDADNLTRLQKCLKGEAYRAVQCLLSTPANVSKIMEILKMRFGQTNHIVESLVEKARSLPAFKEDKLENLIEFGTAVTNLTATVISLNSSAHLNNPILLKELEQKLPVPLRMKWREWSLKEDNGKQDVINFSSWIEGQVNIACQLCPPRVRSDDKEKRKQDPWGFRKREERVLAAVEEQSKRKERKCLYCEDPKHLIYKCEKFSKEELKVRWKWAREKKCCYSCLNVGHNVAACRSGKPCKINNCKQMHHVLLHFEKNVEPEKNYHAFAGSNRVNLMILPVNLEGPKGTISTYAFLDPGATISLINEATATELGLEGPSVPLSFKGLHPLVQVPESRKVNVTVMTADGKNSFEISGVRTKKWLPLPSQSVTKKLLKKWSHTKNLDIATYNYCQPTILLGMDNSKIIRAQEYIEGPPNSPDAQRTALGWTLCGKINETSLSEYNYMLQEEEQDELHQLVKRHFAIEDMGVKITAEKPRGVQDRIAQQIMDSTIKNCGTHWEAGLLWRSSDVKLPPSKNIATNRLSLMEKKMDKDPNFADQYVKKIEEYIQKGFARKLSSREAEIEDHRTFYLPHFMAKNPKKPKKLRFVFDAAAKINGTCLNDALLKGPDQMTCLPAVLFKFREKAIGITGDIKDMFHRVHIRREDASAQRFLWRGMDRQNPPQVYEMSVLIFGAACSPALAQEVKNRNAKQFEDQYPEAVKSIIDKHYVDDYLDSCDSVGEALKRFSEIREIHNKGGFNLCNWVSNSKEFIDGIPQDLRLNGAELKQLEGEPDNQVERVLGLFWKPNYDVFTFSLSFLKLDAELLQRDRLPTKREVLALVMSIYDPLGFLALFTVKAKMLMQDIWRAKIGWDDEIPQSCKAKWDIWISELENIKQFQLPRCYSLNFSTATSVELHVFCDASEQAYGAVAYFRIVKVEEVQISFVTARSRVAPLKPMSMPRMELQAAVVGCRLAQFIIAEHQVKISRSIFWSDNQTVLCWLKADGKTFKPFVAHRIGEIQETSDSHQWRYVPTKENVADELTRDKTQSEFGPTSRWVNGPEFLHQDESEWPKAKNLLVQEEDAEAELRRDFVGIVANDTCLIDICRFSSWKRLVRTTAYLFRSKNCFLMKRFKRKSEDTMLSPEEILQAEKWWWRSVQQQSFHEEICLISKGLPVSKSSRLRNLNPYLDEDQVLRVGGRIERAEGLSFSTKFPVILDPKHPFTKLLVMKYHLDGGHHGQERVVNEIRQRYYILQIRTAVKESWHHCQTCKNSRSTPIVPQMAPLPTNRLQCNVPPFTNTGLDYFGPLEVRIGRRHEKRWIALFTCLSTRAIHLEIAHALSTDSCIMAIRRFIARRGCPAEIMSDNGTNFKGAKNELQMALEELDQNRITNMCTSKGITWKFIPPGAPHMGGSWERLVRSTKTALYATLNEVHPSDEVLKTLIIEAEHIVNCHPLTHVPVDPVDPEALTPNHFLIGRSSNLNQFGAFSKTDFCLRKQWRISQALADQFWTRWVKEYLPTLLRRTKWFNQQEQITVGDIVLEVSPQLPRNSWPMGMVVNLYPGPDGKVRAVDVKFTNSILKRAVANLCILDVHKEDNNDK